MQKSFRSKKTLANLSTNLLPLTMESRERRDNLLHLKMELDMKENGMKTQTSVTVAATKYGRMDLYTKVTGKMTRPTVAGD
jgi:hypothetical protein